MVVAEWTFRESVDDDTVSERTAIEQYIKRYRLPTLISRLVEN